MEMEALTGSQRKYLRALAHPLKPVVLIGSRGFTQAVSKALDEALCKHELVKIKFNDDKTKTFKSQTSLALEKATHSRIVGTIGHTVIYYRPHPEADKRKIVLPLSESPSR
jgi:RNA-binding protein